MPEIYTYKYNFAQAYGEGGYSENLYVGNTETQTEQPGGIFAPNTGFLQTAEPAVLIPAILIASVLIGIFVVLIKKFVRNRKR